MRPSLPCALLFAPLLVALLVPAASGDHIASTEGTRDGYRCDGGWCDDGQHYTLDCTGGTCTGDMFGFATFVHPHFGDGIWLDDNDIVLGVVHGGEAKAYPLRTISGENGWELIVDDVGGKAVVVTYCPLCRSGAVWSPTVDGVDLTVRNSGAIWNYDLVMYDVQTRSLWSQVSGEAIGRLAADGIDDGPHHGKALDLVPAQSMQWAAFQNAYPGAVAMEQPRDENGKALCTCPKFLARNDWVTGIERNGAALAFPHDVMERDGLVQIPFADMEVVAVFAGRGVHVFETAGRTFTLEADGLHGSDAVVYHPVTGEALDGSRRLVAVPSLVSDRDEWINFHPRSAVFEGRAAEGPIIGTPGPRDTPGWPLVWALAALVGLAWRRRRA